MNLRNMAVAGHFYPDNCEQIKAWFSRWEHEPLLDKKFSPKALIVPHAGYMYSGACAYKAYAQVSSSPKHVVIIGPSHRIPFDGASIGDFDHIQTPCGPLSCDRIMHEHLTDKFPWLCFIHQAHKEHSTEVQFPFIKESIPNALVTEIVYGSISAKLLCALMEECADLPETLLVISTDLSHFYSLDEANQLDNAYIKAIKDLHVEGLKNGEACGMKGVEALILLAKERSWNVQILEYYTSFNQTGDRSQVVGYMSAIMG